MIVPVNNDRVAMLLEIVIGIMDMNLIYNDTVYIINS
jgi:hypothetical protein